MIAVLWLVNLPLYLLFKTHHYIIGFVYAFLLAHVIIMVVAGVNRRLGEVDETQTAIVGLLAVGVVFFEGYRQIAAIVFNGTVYWIILLVIKDISYEWTFRNYYSNVTNFTVCYFFICACIYFTKSIFRQYQALLLQRNEQLSKQTLDLQELDQFKNHLFAVISHDLSSPLYNLQATIKLLNEGKLSVEQSKSTISEIQLKTKDVSQLLSNLLNWANMQLSGYKSIIVEIPLREVVEETILFLQDEINAKQLLVYNNIDGRTIGLSDENHLQLIVRNLLSNAIKFSFISGTVTIEADEKPDEIIISIQDTGTGIQLTELERVLSGTYRSSTLGTQGEKGSGLGLWISREFIQKLGGEFWAVSREGVGSTFYFTLPKLQN